jgi:hypothetical protein
MFPHRPGITRERPAPAPPIGCHETQQEDDRLAGDKQQQDHG